MCLFDFVVGKGTGIWILWWSSRFENAKRCTEDIQRRKRSLCGAFDAAGKSSTVKPEKEWWRRSLSQWVQSWTLRSTLIGYWASTRGLVSSFGQNLCSYFKGIRINNLCNWTSSLLYQCKMCNYFLKFAALVSFYVIFVGLELHILQCHEILVHF